MKIFAFLSALLLLQPPVLCKNLEELATAEGLTTFANFLTKFSLSDALSKDGPFTVFAPTNEAFAKLPADVLDDNALMKKILQYHIVKATINSTDVINDVTVITSEGIPLRTNIYLRSEFYPGFITVNGKRVTRTDVEADNGLLHVVADVVYPFPQDSIFQALEKDPEGKFGTLLTALEKADLKDKLLSGAEPLTLFAPTNEAFKKIPEEKLKALMEDKERLGKVLLRHVIPGTLFQKGISWMVHETEGVERVQTQVFKGGVVKVVSLEGGARVKEADIVAKNGVVHVIDHVI